MKKILFIIFLILVVMVVINKLSPKNENQPSNSVSPVNSGWQAYSGNPILSLGDQLKGAMWNDPSVIKIGSEYVMYLTSYKAPGQTDVVPFRAVSADGIKWNINLTPLLSGGPKGSFDELNVETPSVIFFNNQYHMFYTAVPAGGLTAKLSIGHAVSTDSIVWSKVGDQPVVRSTGNVSDWNGYQVAEPGAAVFNNKIYLYFTAVGLRGDGTKPPFVKRTIGLVTSVDGFNFSSPQRVVEQSALFPADKNYQGYSTINAAVYNGRVHLFYDVFQYIKGQKPEEHLQVALHHASSSDGISFTQDPVPIFTRENFKWTYREIRSPSVIHDGNLFKMWFAGDDIISKKLFGIGYATISDSLVK